MKARQFEVRQFNKVADQYTKVILLSDHKKALAENDKSWQSLIEKKMKEIRKEVSYIYAAYSYWHIPTHDSLSGSIMKLKKLVDKRGFK